MAKKLAKAQLGKAVLAGVKAATAAGKVGIKAAKETYVAAKKQKGFEKFKPKAVNTYNGRMPDAWGDTGYSRSRGAGSNKLGGAIKTKKK